MQKTSTRGTPLGKNNSRWSWMAGATAASAAAAAASQAQTAQITLINNQLDSITGNSISLDVTSGHPFGRLISNTATALHGFIFIRVASSQGIYIGAGLEYDEKAHRDSYFAKINGQNSELNTSNHSIGKPTKCFGLITITLKDPNVDGGQTTDGLLEFEAFNQSATDQTVALLAIFYPESGNTTPDLTIDEYTGAITGSYTNVGSSDDGVYTAAVPEPSGLALLALGAGGILAARKRGKFASSDKVPSQDN